MVGYQENCLISHINTTTAHQEPFLRQESRIPRREGGESSLQELLMEVRICLCLLPGEHRRAAAGGRVL